MGKPFYITTTLPYVNAEPHIGFAMELVRADAIARYRRELGDDVLFNTGTDEHGAKIHEAALAAGEPPQAYVDRMARRFGELASALNVSTHRFIRTTDEKHIRAAEEIWRRVNERGFIYKKNYRIRYCVGCELEKTDSELGEDGRCPLHPNLEIEVREEENYFFKWSAFESRLLEHYAANPEFVTPDFRFNEVKAFVERGLQDFSISRLYEKMPWGVPVPGDPDHVMYVWFDALPSYISTLGWPDDQATFDAYWRNGTPVQYCGKDNTRQQAAMWQAMLMAAELPLTRTIVIDGFITSGGQKMSKSLGNVINPFEVIGAFEPHTPFPEDVLRFVLLHDIPSFEDGDITRDSIRESYQANLQNGLGNLVSRVLQMSSTHGIVCDTASVEEHRYSKLHLERFDTQKAVKELFGRVSDVDKYIQETEPFKKIKTDPEKGRSDIRHALDELYRLARELRPFLPRTALAIEKAVADNQKPEVPLFGRLHA